MACHSLYLFLCDQLSPTIGCLEHACQLSFLDWNFLETHNERCREYDRMGMMCRTMERYRGEAFEQMEKQADRFLCNLPGY